MTTYEIEPFDAIEQFTTFPNAVLDYVMKECDGGEWKIVSAVIRKTTGYRKAKDRISISQFMEITGLSNRAVIDATNRAIEHGYILRTADGQGYAYSLNTERMP